MPKKKVLLVDDSESALLIEELMLSRNYEVLTAKSGAEGLRTAAEKAPDLVLLDILMPNMDGLAVCRMLRSMDATKTTPIVMVTTRGDEKSVEAAFASGCTDY